MQHETSGILAGYLTQAALATQLNVDLRTLQLWESRREGPAITRVGKRPYYRIEAVASWLASRERPMVREGGRQRRRVSASQSELR
jgi:hypothetical protein